MTELYTNKSEDEFDNFSLQNNVYRKLALTYQSLCLNYVQMKSNSNRLVGELEIRILVKGL